MMKELEAFTYEKGKIEKEIEDFRKLLTEKDELSEKKDILPFFRKRRHLASKIFELYPENHFFVEQIAYEFDIFGDYKADLVLGSHDHFFFIEFEDAKINSIFKKETRYKPQFSCRFETGFSQIIDWFYKLDNLQGSEDFTERFGFHKIQYEGLLVIGRDSFMNQAEINRLAWRVKRVVTNSKHISCITYDQLLDILTERIDHRKKISGLL